MSIFHCNPFGKGFLPLQPYLAIMGVCASCLGRGHERDRDISDEVSDLGDSDLRGEGEVHSEGDGDAFGRDQLTLTPFFHRMRARDCFSTTPTDTTMAALLTSTLEPPKQIHKKFRGKQRPCRRS